ncbi:MAG: DUF4349 domain-containing protein, partial [Butyricicoccus sp.]|nr:DUF4349 domain-containing protein [Butyricicoccus sp.]
ASVYGGTNGSSAMWSMADEAEWDYPADSNAPAPEPEEAPASGELQPIAGNVPENAKLIYTADINLQTTEFDEATAGLSRLVNEMGGYFENSSVNNYSSYRSGNYTVRVPAKSFDAFCAQVGQLCQMTYISRSAEDVSESYYDLESRLATQQTKLARLQELLEKAESMEDIITIESAISDTELNIEWLTGDLRHYDSLVGYSTVYISLDEVYRLDDVEQPAIGFGAKMAEALKNGCSTFVWSLQNLLLAVAYNWVGWLIFLVIAAAAAVVIVRAVRRRRKKREDRDGE